jgi:hypothetical protein
MAIHKELKCKHHGLTKHRINSKGSGGICLKCDTKNQTIKKTRRRLKLLKLFGRRCFVCHYDRCDQALDFHHIIPKEKKFALSSKKIVSQPWETVLEEARKCVLICSNCHREYHAGVLKKKLRKVRRKALT